MTVSKERLCSDPDTIAMLKQRKTVMKKMFIRDEIDFAAPQQSKL